MASLRLNHNYSPAPLHILLILRIYLYLPKQVKLTFGAKPLPTSQLATNEVKAPYLGHVQHDSSRKRQPAIMKSSAVLPSPRPRVCLNMIVRNETAVIERCLASVRGHIDAWVVVDTGSTDDTQAKIREALKGIPGALHERPWRNFGSNRSEAVSLAYQSGCDYFLFIDADDVLLTPPDFQWAALTHHAYEMWLNYGTYRYVRQVLVSAKLRWQWMGVLHEYPEATPAATSIGRLEQPQIGASTEGARSSNPNKYECDAALLLSAFAVEPDNTRYLFYLAQSYRDAGKLDDALTAYDRRAVAGGWEEEAWVSQLEAARLRERLGRPVGEIHMAYLAVFERRPTRAEPLADLARVLRVRQAFAQAYLYAKHAASLIQPDDRLFIEADCYAWRALDELAVAAYWTDRFAECAAVCDDLLARNVVPERELDRINANRNFAIAKLR